MPPFFVVNRITKLLIVFFHITLLIIKSLISMRISKTLKHKNSRESIQRSETKRNGWFYCYYSTILRLF